MAHYRTSFPHATVLPKMHILDPLAEAVACRSWFDGRARSGVCAHTHLHSLERNFCGIANKVNRLKYIFDMYNIETCPQLMDLRPEAKKRKKRQRLYQLSYCTYI